MITHTPALLLDKQDHLTGHLLPEPL